MYSKLKENLGGGAIGALVASLAVGGALSIPASAQQETGGPLASASHGTLQHVKRALLRARVANRRSVRAIRMARIVRRQHNADIGSLEDRLEDRIADIEGRMADVEDQITDIDDQVGELEALLAGVTRGEVDGNDTLRLSGMNVQLVNATGETDEKNGLGNLIIGYNEDRSSPTDRDGSHYLVVGDLHEWTASGGIVAGFNNTASGAQASVSGGRSNTASGDHASVSGGWFNEASGFAASVSGGGGNTASGNRASVSGGGPNIASGIRASVSGGDGNLASGVQASVSGGFANEASGHEASILGGERKTEAGDKECHPTC